jgi:hypothetical protein
MLGMVCRTPYRRPRRIDRQIPANPSPLRDRRNSVFEFTRRSVLT